MLKRYSQMLSKRVNLTRKETKFNVDLYLSCCRNLLSMIQNFGPSNYFGNNRLELCMYKCVQSGTLQNSKWIVADIISFFFNVQKIDRISLEEES